MKKLREGPTTKASVTVGSMVHFVLWGVCKPALWVSDAKLYVFDDPGAYYVPRLEYAEDSWHTIADCTTGYEASHTNTCNSFIAED